MLNNNPNTPNTTELYDLKQDPGEQIDRSAELPEKTRALMTVLQAIIDGTGLDHLDEELPEGIDPELKEQLEALGYLGG